MLDTYREILNANGGAGTPIVITSMRWGTTDGANTSNRTPAYLTENTPDEQANFVVEALSTTITRGDVSLAIVSNLNGCQSDNQDACYYSLIDVNNAQRPVFTSIQEMN
jgi:hypothetical protein